MAVRRDERVGILGRVTTPLGLLTLGIFVIGGILASRLAIESELTVLIGGMLVGLALLSFTAFQTLQKSGVAGVANHSPFFAIAEMNLTANDIRTIYQAKLNNGELIEASTVLLGDKVLRWDKRLEKLGTLGLAHGPFSQGGRMRLTSEGRAVARLIKDFSAALGEEHWCERKTSVLLSPPLTPPTRHERAGPIATGKPK
jgi:hypothetical protein